MKKSLLILLVVSSMILASCNSVIGQFTITLNKNILALTVNEQETLTTTIAPSGLEDPLIVWVNDDSSVATINEGTVTALQAGTTAIKVFLDLNKNFLHDLGEPSDQCSLTVTAPVIETIPVSSVSLSHTSLSLEISEEITLVATVLPENASTQTLVWLNSDESIIEVKNGHVRAIARGNSTVTAYVDENSNEHKDNDEKYATVLVNVLESVIDPSIPVSSLTMSKTSLSLEEGSFETISATVLPNNATNQTITWFSSNHEVATVNLGRVEAIKAGSVTITAFVDENANTILDDDEKRDTLALTVTAIPASSEPSGDLIPASGESLPIGNKTVSGPNNATPVDITNWINYDFSSTLPPYWSFIMGNNKKSTSSDFYAESSGGGFKFSKTYYGLQSPLLNSWLKTEVRLTISQVNGNSASQSQYEGKPIFHIYSYDHSGHYLGMQTYEQQNKFADIKEIKFYIANPEMAYFEIRLNAFPYKGSQCYNFGVSQISIKGWPYGL